MKSGPRDNYYDNRNIPMCVNWGRGRLRSYQSFTSFAAIFCKLNCIKPPDFRRFWLKKVGVNILEPNKSGYTNEQLKIIANLLDEPVRIVRTVVYKTANNRKFRFIENRLKTSASVKYCEKCVKSGYHGWIHDDALIAKCPIHGEHLQFTYIRMKAGSSWDCAVSALSEVFKEHCVDWPGFVSVDYVRISRRLFSSQRGYFEWKRAVASEIESWTPQYINYRYSIRDCVITKIDEILGRLQWIRKLDSKFMDSLSAAPRSLSPKIYRLRKSLSRELTSVLRKISLEELLTILNRSYLLEESRRIGVKNDRLDDYQDILVHVINKCDCVLRKDQHSQWTRLSKEEAECLSYCTCPYAVAREALYSRWGVSRLLYGFREGGQPHYLSLRIHLYVLNGVFDIKWVRHPVLSNLPVARPKFTLELSEFLSSVQLAIFESYLSELRSWLNEADAGKDISSPIDVLPRAFLKEKDGLVIAVLVW